MEVRFFSSNLDFTQIYVQHHDFHSYYANFTEFCRRIAFSLQELLKIMLDTVTSSKTVVYNSNDLNEKQHFV